MFFSHYKINTYDVLGFQTCQSRYRQSLTDSSLKLRRHALIPVLVLNRASWEHYHALTNQQFISDKRRTFRKANAGRGCPLLFESLLRMLLTTKEVDTVLQIPISVPKQLAFARDLLIGEKLQSGPWDYCFLLSDVNKIFLYRKSYKKVFF